MSGSKAPRPTGIQRLQGWKTEPSRKGGLADCTLIIATYRRPKEILCLLTRLMEVPDPPGEVVIVDGSPDQETQDAIVRWVTDGSMPFELVYVRSPAGLTRQRNVGIDASSRSFIFFLDDDCLPEAGYFGNIRLVFAEDTAGQVVAVCGSIINHMGRPLSLKWRLRLLLRLTPSCQGLKYYRNGASGPFSIVAPFVGVRSVDAVPGGAAAYRRSVFDRHRFSEFFSGYAQGEDLEMSRRIAGDGKLLWCGEAHVRHLPAAAGRPDWFERGRMKVRNRHFIWKRHLLDATVSDHLRFWSDVLFLLVCDSVGVTLRPRGWKVRHILGTVWGIIGCIFSPPRYEEPPARKAYEVCLRTLRTRRDAEAPLEG